MNKCALWLSVLLLGLFSCGQDELTGINEDPQDGMDAMTEMMDEVVIIPPVSETIAGTISGLVVNEDDEIVKYAKIMAAGIVTQTDELGYFEFSSDNLPSAGVHLKVTHDDYIDSYRNVFPSLESESFITIQMTLPQIATFASSEGLDVQLDSGGRIVIPADAIADETGQPYEGQVLAEMAFYDPSSDDKFELKAPGDLRGMDEEMNVVQLVSYGMLAITIYDPFGTELNLRSGAAAQLEFPSPQGSPAVLPLWYYDEASGYWVEEGEAIYEDDAYRAEVNHFSFWNCDADFPIAEINGKIEYDDGTPASNRRVRITAVNWGLTAYGYTDGNGNFRGKVPADQELELTIINNCGQDTRFDLGVVVSDSDLGVYTLDADMTTEIRGRLIDCETMTGVSPGYAWVSNGETYFVLRTDADGQYAGRIPFCTNEDYILVGYDALNNGVSDPVDLNLPTQIEVADILICGDTEVFFNINAHPDTGPTGVNPNLLMPGQGFSYSNQALNIFVSRGDDFNTESIVLTIFQPVPGENIGTIQYSRFGQDIPFVQVSCSLDATCMSISLTEFELEEGGFISGTYWVSGGPGGNFRCEIIDYLSDRPLGCVEITSSGGFCNGDTPINLVPIAQGGAAPYTFNWSEGTEGNLSTTGEGLYEVTVTDYLGDDCSMQLDYQFADRLEFERVITPATCGMSDGAAQILVTNYEGDFDIIWEDGTVGDRIMDRPQGWYKAIVTFNNGMCENELSVNITCV